MSGAGAGKRSALSEMFLPLSTAERAAFAYSRRRTRRCERCRDWFEDYGRHIALAAAATRPRRADRAAGEVFGSIGRAQISVRIVGCVPAVLQAGPGRAALSGRLDGPQGIDPGDGPPPAPIDHPMTGIQDRQPEPLRTISAGDLKGPAVRGACLRSADFAWFHPYHRRRLLEAERWRYQPRNGAACRLTHQSTEIRSGFDEMRPPPE